MIPIQVSPSREIHVAHDVYNGRPGLSLAILQKTANWSGFKMNPRFSGDNYKDRAEALAKAILAELAKEPTPQATKEAPQ